jgi:hypothetical protein
MESLVLAEYFFALARVVQIEQGRAQTTADRQAAVVIFNWAASEVTRARERR